MLVKTYRNGKTQQNVFILHVVDWKHHSAQSGEVKERARRKLEA